MRLAAICILTLPFYDGICADPIPAKVIGVIDGNTLTVIAPLNDTLTIVLSGIDSPELSQLYGNKAKHYLERLVLRKDVTIYIHGKDRFKNHVAVVMFNDVDVRIRLLQKGLAWTRENESETALEVHRLKAAGDQKGLWSESNPTPPWTHRRRQSMLQPKSR